jgi:glycine betaine/proline transport system permease protein
MKGSLSDSTKRVVDIKNRKWLIAGGLVGLFLLASKLLASVELSLPVVPIADGVDVGIEWATINLAPFFDGIKLVVIKLLVAITAFFDWVPWIVWVVAVGGAAFRWLGVRTAMLFIAGLLTIVSVGLWDHAMSTIALVSTSMVLILVTGIPIGVLASRNDRFESALRPVLDAMQTMPSFVYLIPVIFLLGSGKVPAVLATMIYATPPAIRLTNLALRQVSPEIKEAARSFGATPFQMLFKVELPLAVATIMAGVNQSLMMAISMVVIASLIGAGGLGNDVLFAMSRVRVGDGFEAGLAILVLAIVVDRSTQALGQRANKDTRTE